MRICTVIALFALAGCTDENPSIADAAVERCPEGDVADCTCADDRAGQKTCDETGQYSACVCETDGGEIVPPDGGPVDAAPECIDGQADREECPEGGERVRACVDSLWGPWGPCQGCAEGQQDDEACGINGRGERSRLCADEMWGDWGPCEDDDVCEDGTEEQEACGLNGNGMRVRACPEGAWSEWTECDDPSECVDGAIDRQPCGLNGNGRQERECVEGRWTDMVACDDPDECIDGSDESEACGVEGNGERGRRCVGGRWGDWAPCDDPDLECEDGEDLADVACGLNGRGYARRRCEDGRVEVRDCRDDDLCVDETVIRGVCGQNDRGIRERACAEGQWGEWSECDDPDECVDDSEQEGACGLNGAGVRQRACLAGRWAMWSPCDDPDGCENGARERDDSGCGLNGRGGRLRVCAEGAWGEWGECDDPDVCTDGEDQTRACGRGGDGERSRVCEAGQWAAWTPCDAEDPCPDPENPECGPAGEERCNGLDDDHDGEVDEGLLEGGAAQFDDGFPQAQARAIDEGLEWLRSQEREGRLEGDNGRHSFLAALVFLEQREGVVAGEQVGYAGLPLEDQALVRRFVRAMITSDQALRNPEARPYVYTTGGSAMTLAAYLRTGGPNDLELEVTAEQALLNAVTTLKANQGRQPPNNNGGWNYGAPNNNGDTSTTHFAYNGLAAAQTVLGDDALPDVPVTDFLQAAQAEDGGVGYHAGNAGNSSMTASGLWMHYLAGTPADDEAVVGARDWLAEHYRYDGMVGGFSPTSTFYYQWAQMKALSAYGDPEDMRFQVRDPENRGHHPGRAGSYYDMTVSLWLWRGEQGQWGNQANQSPRGWTTHSSHCFALLTLMRSFGGVPVQLPDLGLTPQCSDEADNDGDGRVDGDDPECALACTALERPVAACRNQRDDDGDGLIDQDDPGCADGNGETEENPGCSNGVDDDDDGVADWPGDPGCASVRDDDEADPEELPACANGVDDDEDGSQDFGGDPTCYSADQDGEGGRYACPGEVEFLWPDQRLVRGDTRGAPNQLQGSCGGIRGGERVYAMHVDRPGRVRLTTVHDDTLVDTVVYVRRGCPEAGSEVACNDDIAEGDPLSTAVFDAEVGLYFVVVDARIGSGEFVLTIDR